MTSNSPSTVAEGFRLPECPRWHDGALWFVDMLSGNVNRLLGDRVETMFSCDHPNALGFLPSGDLLVVDGRNAALVTVRDGKVVGTQDLSSRAYHLNDMILDRNGWVYVDASMGDPFKTGWKADGQILLVKPGQPPETVADGIISPNGIAISPDGQTLVVGESMGPGGSPSGARLWAYRIGADGSLSDGRVMAAIERGSGDGLCFDAEGGVWVACSFGHEVQRFVDGEVVERVQVADRRWALACALGGPELRTLHICTVPRPPEGQPSQMEGGRIEVVDVAVSGFDSWA